MKNETMTIKEFKNIKQDEKIIINNTIYVCTFSQEDASTKCFRLENGKRENYVMLVNKPSQKVRFFHRTTNGQLI